MAKQTEKKQAEVKDDVITPSQSQENVLTPENDEAVKASEAISTSADSKTQEFNDDKESKNKVKEHEEFVKDVEEGKKVVSGNSPADISEATKPMVADEAGRPKYETASQYMAAESAKGNLHTKE